MRKNIAITNSISIIALVAVNIAGIKRGGIITVIITYIINLMFILKEYLKSLNDDNYYIENEREEY